ncbi:hypothetical protein QFC22_000085 [Naganishia vaughanmartiniae]|uniref:Uncharacterized protein n=1 Tax=Naganishia vaughanmartiniae TaxID=1424756 RepID=A0ACC2XP35_9TREE|nr:hypothetical protein QFC22_000085 [Naganishia vaughanmartiniae]
MVHLSPSRQTPPRRQQRLPELSDVLMRKTRAPLDLYCFYIFLQQENAEDALDFWLDVQQHENLCRAYFKDLKRTDRTVVDDWPEFHDHARRYGSIFSSVAGLDDGNTTSASHDPSWGRWQEKGGLPENNDEKHPRRAEEHSEDVHGLGDEYEYEYEPTRSTSFRARRRDTESHHSRTPINVNNMGTTITTNNNNEKQQQQPQNLGSVDASPRFSDGGDGMMYTTTTTTSPRATTGHPIGIGHPGDARGPSRASFVDSFFGTGTGTVNSNHNPSHSQQMKRNQPTDVPAGGSGVLGGLRSTSRRRVTSSRAPTVISRKQAITQHDLVASGERIYMRYLLPGAEKEIYLPPQIRIHDFPSSPEYLDHSPQTSAAETDPRIPDYFHVAKEYIFKALQDDAFIRFIRAKAFCNLTRLGTFIRLFAGLFALFDGYT